jgi:hypothetical protein
MHERGAQFSQRLCMTGLFASPLVIFATQLRNAKEHRSIFLMYDRLQVVDCGAAARRSLRLTWPPIARNLALPPQPVLFQPRTRIPPPSRLGLKSQACTAVQINQ